MDVVEIVARAVQAAIETMPYRWVTQWDDETDEETSPTLRQFYEGTWQGGHADELFPAVAEVATRAAIAALFDWMAVQPGSVLQDAGEIARRDWWLAKMRKEALGQ